MSADQPSTATRGRFQALFLPVDGAQPGQRLAVFQPAQGSVPRGCVLYLHPLAEEMNKSRRMAALQARALAQAGYAVLQLDLLGCGDSSGDFGDATWQAWIEDVLRGCRWLRGAAAAGTGASGSGPLWLWGLRAGCLLAAQAAGRLDQDCHFLFWQPPTHGRSQLQQFLRLKLAGDMQGGQAKGAMQALRDALAADTPVEVGGYRMAPDLASGLEQAELAPPPGPGTGRRVVWLELSLRDDPAWSPVSQQAMERWRQAGYAVQNQLVQGPAFWQTSDIAESPALVAATTAALTA